MKSFRFGGLVLGSLLLFGCRSAPPEGLARPSDPVLDWAQTVALGAEFGASSRPVVRWNGPVRVSVAEGSPDPSLADAVAFLNAQVAGSGTSANLAAPADPSAGVQVYFVPFARFSSLAQSHGFPYVPGNFGYFYCFWDEGYTLKKAYILIAVDAIGPSKIRHFVLEELVQSFGLMNDSPTYPDSLFYSSGTAGGSASDPSPQDARLVRFLYRHLVPGSTRAGFQAAYSEVWAGL